jgi:2-polyprenyl-3-methyl-5-hydroxy-6-metoxy-1,4-benzoquinol methylase
MDASAFDPLKALAETGKLLKKMEGVLKQVEALEVSRPNLLRVFEKFRQATGRFPTRDDFALQLVENIQGALGISLRGKECIDIGCRSGENAIAMQQVGAKVIGIDPDDSELETAREKGMESRQFFKTTLQEYRSEGKKFDVATVFLWNIPFKEREPFAAALREIIHASGHVVIGYADEPYDKDPNINVLELMRTVFSRVERFEFPDSLNQYMLICSGPQTVS